ncbi:tripartite tricarboxylate transporter permease [Xanthobacter tagetidis]|jgi:TctA family transporter|uniref:Tripartite tricarboxylate transporter permease n=1 Tax=Xanthobacter tagetidis TaxID=60216 RepID=A0A3L7A1K7_9HYPH|nr:tripartite tricarboxylate transporter permease [Xanthobacter tagetidis]MBB6307199.1 TctA family transporter [Xanthobacter tagetidis]RLP74037.1 tripartite tricarboxylate transporter permease [Xanthobacter tagetidis]
MSFLDNLALGFSVALSLQNLAYCLLGTVLGTAIGVLPGLGPVATISMLMPLTFGLDPTTALILLAGIYYGAQYGGSTTAILVNLPGETSSVVTAIDGYQMARQGRAREALVVAALGSFFAGTVGTLAIAGFAPALSELALGFGAPEYFSLMVLGLIAAVVLAHGSVLKAVAMVVLGLVLGLVGTDVNSGVLRFTFGISDLFDGLDFVAVAMGLFGIAEVISNLERKDEARAAVTLGGKGSFLLSREDFRAAWPAVVRGTGLGAILGILPGGGAILGSFASYMLEKRIARDPSRFGKGAIEGVAGPESANNAGAQTSFIPMLTLGLPSNAVMAMMIGALIIHNIQPGPQVMNANPSLFWGLIASMWIGNLLLVILNLPLVGVWVQMLRIPYRVLYPAILVLCAIGVYSVSNSTALVYVMAAFGVLGYVLAKLQCEPAPLLLGFVLGPLMEENLRRALTISGGDASVFFTQPVSLALLLLAAGLLVVMAMPRASRLRDAAFEEET